MKLQIIKNPPPTETAVNDFVAATTARLGREPTALISILQAIQNHFRYLPPEALKRVAATTNIHPADISEVATFYSQFRLHPVGEHLLRVCNGTACHVKGADLIHDAITRQLDLPAGADTDRDGKFTVEKVACLGCCTLAPVLQAAVTTYGHLVAENIPRLLEEVIANAGKISRQSLVGKDNDISGCGEVRICLDSCCVARGSDKVYEAILTALQATGIRAALKQVGCVIMCGQTPLIEIVIPNKPPAVYTQVRPVEVRAILEKHFPPPPPLRRLGNFAARAFSEFVNDKPAVDISRHQVGVRDKPLTAFLDRQVHLAMAGYGEIDPLNLTEYLAAGGFAALEKALTKMNGETVIGQISASGLRGRGGAGFSTGRKWKFVQLADSNEKYLIANGDEGDPGAFMDRMLMESFPFRVIEGMVIAAYAVGANKGYLYIRAEYPHALDRLRKALAICHEAGYLGNDILDTNFSLDLQIKVGAGAFICGEETALLESIEGRAGRPRLRPPYPAQAGLWGKPTLINNVESFSLVPWIISNGAKKFACYGTEKSKGTKVFALAGKVRHGGLIEVPLGITLREIVSEIGGGIADDKEFKAVLIGGPSGGCVPAELCDTRVDYESLSAVGSIMGSGGLVVLDEDDCMVDIARYFLSFTQTESCGKCSLCRLGTKRLLDILERICAGKGKPNDLADLETLCGTVGIGSLCGLGKTAPNPVLTTLKYFRHEYEAHLAGHCPAGKCKNLIAYKIIGSCIGCTICSQHCPVDAIPMQPYQQHFIIDEKCIRCDTCRQVCPESAVLIV